MILSDIGDEAKIANPPGPHSKMALGGGGSPKTPSNPRAFAARKAPGIPGRAMRVSETTKTEKGQDRRKGRREERDLMLTATILICCHLDVLKGLRAFTSLELAPVAFSQQARR